MYKIGFNNIVIDPSTDETIFRMVGKAILRRKLPKDKEPKVRAKDGEYCPKKKAGQSWAHIDKSKEDANEETGDDTKD